jgi:DNA repair protein RadA/Sms
LTAVLEKYLGQPLSQYDVFVSLTGGFASKEPAIDVAVSMAILSSLTNQPLPDRTACIGEVGLLGEIRPVPLMTRRLKEATRLGFKTIITHSHRSLREATQAVGLPLRRSKPKTEE